MDNLNIYNQTEFEAYFPTTKTFLNLCKNLPNAEFKFEKHYKRPDGRGRDVIINHTDYPVDIFYYLEFIFRLNPDKIYDIGCGQNQFKRFANESIIGIDPGLDPFTARPGGQCYIDMFDTFDNTFVKKYDRSMKYAISVNALHFIEETQFRNQVQQFVNLIEPGGRGALILNSARFSNAQHGSDDKYYLKELDSISGINFLVIDIDPGVCEDDYSNGNIRLVFDKLF